MLVLVCVLPPLQLTLPAVGMQGQRLEASSFDKDLSYARERPRLLLVKEEQDYCSCYCEENVYRLCETAVNSGIESQSIFAVFVSNKKKQVPFFCLKNCNEEAVVWDYHVFMIIQSDNGSWVYDLDIADVLPFPTPFNVYCQCCVDAVPEISEQFEPMCFRVIPAHVLFTTFRSDRSHMRRDNGLWLMPPPPWPLIGSKLSNGRDSSQKNTNLFSRFIEMEDAEVEDCKMKSNINAEVHTKDQFYKKFGSYSSGK